MYQTNQYNVEDKGGGDNESRYEAIAHLTDMNDEIGYNNKRVRENEIDSAELSGSRVNKPRLDDLQTSEAAAAVETQQTGERNDPEITDVPEINDVSTNIMVVEFIVITREQKVIVDKARVRRMFLGSPFWGKFSGIPRPNFIKHELVLHIDNKDDIPALLTIDKLVYNSMEWPITCRRSRDAALYHLGVLKGIHPDVPENSIEDELKENGVRINKVIRMQNFRGPTYCVKVEFLDSLPEEIEYAGYTKLVHKYLPPASSLICNNCSKPGHKASSCSARPQCPICSSTTHTKWNCPKEFKKCSNCGGPHSAKFGLCPVLIKEKEIMHIRINNKIPRHQAKNIWEQKQEERRYNEVIESQNRDRIQNPSHDMSSDPTLWWDQNPSSLNIPNNQNRQINQNQSSHNPVNNFSSNMQSNQRISSQNQSNTTLNRVNNDSVNNIQQISSQSNTPNQSSLDQRYLNTMQAQNIVPNAVRPRCIIMANKNTQTEEEDSIQGKKMSPSPRESPLSKDTLIKIILIVMEFMNFSSNNSNPKDKKNQLLKLVDNLYDKDSPLNDIVDEINRVDGNQTSKPSPKENVENSQIPRPMMPPYMSYGPVHSQQTNSPSPIEHVGNVQISRPMMPPYMPISPIHSPENIQTIPENIDIAPQSSPSQAVRPKDHPLSPVIRIVPNKTYSNINRFTGFPQTAPAQPAQVSHEHQKEIPNQNKEGSFPISQELTTNK